MKKITSLMICLLIFVMSCTGCGSFQDDKNNSNAPDKSVDKFVQNENKIDVPNIFASFINDGHFNMTDYLESKGLESIEYVKIKNGKNTSLEIKAKTNSKYYFLIDIIQNDSKWYGIPTFALFSEPITHEHQMYEHSYTIGAENVQSNTIEICSVKGDELKKNDFGDIVDKTESEIEGFINIGGLEYIEQVLNTWNLNSNNCPFETVTTPSNDKCICSYGT